MEYYFSGTIERIIFENPSSFFESSCSTSAIPMPKILMILRLLWQEPWQISWKAKTTPSGVSWSIILNTESSSKSVTMNVPNPLARAWWNIFPAITLRNWSQNSPKIVDLYGDNTIDKILEAPEN